MSTHTKLLIIGSGPAGYTAAIYAARASLNPILITGWDKGGQLTITTDVENYPGFKSILGPKLMEKMEAQALSVGTEIIEDYVKEVRFDKKPFEIVTDIHYSTSQEKQKKYKNFVSYTADTVIISTGAKARWLGLESEEKYRGFGVSGCATCDGFFFKEKDVCVVGGGDTAIEEALFLTNLVNKVYVVHRRDELRASKIMQERAFKNKKIDFIWDTELNEVLGNGKNVTGVSLKNVKTDKITKINLSGVFIAIGHNPNTEIFKGKLDMDEQGYLITKNTKTKIPGVFAAGDCQDKIYRQAVTAGGQGCMAAMEAERYITAKLI